MRKEPVVALVEHQGDHAFEDTEVYLVVLMYHDERSTARVFHHMPGQAAQFMMCEPCMSKTCDHVAAVRQLPLENWPPC